MVRLKKRNRKFNGSRNHGKGNAKNRRGKGGKGGWGRAGMHKQRFTYITVYERDWMANGGHMGFSSIRPIVYETLNLFEINQLAEKGKLEKKEGKYYFEFEGKILGSGKLSVPVTVKARSFSEGAAAKIKKAGGEVIATEPVV
ncbi:MAG: uL15 family ribosomal protein [Candidatus Micrarchaeota archaeon]|nr:uL15 family ribosomal protein [Candidatus Micrarchaeota archaeon]